VDHARIFTGIPVKLDKKAMILNCPDVPFVRKEKNQFFTVSLQLPKSLQDVYHAPLINAKILSGSLNFDPLLKQFLVHYFGTRSQSNLEKSKRSSLRHQKIPESTAIRTLEL
jgi:hypothetical protein